MAMRTIFKTEFGTITTITPDAVNIADKVKITGKHKQRAQDKARRTDEQFMRVAAIERKKDKKAGFFARHKNNK